MFEATIKNVDKNVDKDDNALTIIMHLPEELEYFKGHFPGRPVLPGVVQTGWAITYGARYLGCPEQVKKLEVIKFRQLIRPGHDVELHLERKANGKLNFTYRQDGEVMSSGRIVYPELV